jgi:hypothetical protein
VLDNIRSEATYIPMSQEIKGELLYEDIVGYVGSEEGSVMDLAWCVTPPTGTT